MNEAQDLVAPGLSQTGFPLVMNAAVLTELNRILKSRSSRASIRSSLNRMRALSTILDKKINQYQLPDELLAVPLIESGYQNLPENKKRTSGAGIWMFMADTARSSGLKVNQNHDERLDPALETDAAMRYFKARHSQFKDWLLALLAYNRGNYALAHAITTYQTKDAWFLNQKMRGGDSHYLAKVMATLLIIKNPKLLD